MESCGDKTCSIFVTACLMLKVVQFTSQITSTSNKVGVAAVGVRLSERALVSFHKITREHGL